MALESVIMVNYAGGCLEWQCNVESNGRTTVFHCHWNHEKGEFEADSDKPPVIYYSPIDAFLAVAKEMEWLKDNPEERIMDVFHLQELLDK